MKYPTKNLFNFSEAQDSKTTANGAWFSAP